MHPKRPNILRVGPGINLSWPEEDKNLNYTIPSSKSYIIYVLNKKDHDFNSFE